MDCCEGLCENAPEHYCYGCDQPFCNRHLYQGDYNEFYCEPCYNEDEGSLW